MARASTPTLLSLDRYAEIMGINPAHFQGGVSQAVMIQRAQCSDVWWQWSWQASDRVSREDLAREIANAEQEIAEALGFWPAPMYFEKEIHRYPRHHRRDLFRYGLGLRAMYRSIQADWGRFIQAGVRAVTGVGTATVAASTLEYLDEDSDGFNETAKVTLPTTLTDPCELLAYYSGYSGAPEWAIRHPRSVEISGGDVILKYWSWQFLKPELTDKLPGADPMQAINLDDSDVYLEEVDVWREYTDSTEVSAQFFWEQEPHGLVTLPVCPSCGDVGCPACAHTVQNGCLHVRDVETGVVVPVPATYDEDAGQWGEVPWLECREPDLVKFWYRAGDVDNLFLSGRRCDPLSHYWAETIAWLATARIERAFCACGNVAALHTQLRVDMAVTPADVSAAWIMSEQDLRNPFGTRIGEVKAWRRISKLSKKVPKVAVI